MNYDEKFSLINSILYPYSSKFHLIDIDSFMEALINANGKISKHLGVSETKLATQIKFIWPNRPKGKLLNFILSLVEYKHCTKCGSYLSYMEFRLNKSNRDGLNNHCKKCHLSATTETQSARQAAYNAAKDLRTPKWANLQKIKEFYDNCPEGFHVDHIHPLRGKLISGLHVENNLQYLPAIDNIKKSNKFEV